MLVPEHRIPELCRAEARTSATLGSADAEELKKELDEAAKQGEAS